MSALPRELQCMSTCDKPPSKKSPSLFRRIDIRLPWLKLVTVIIIGVIAILDLLDLTISKAEDPLNKIRIAPMSYHVRATERYFKDKMLVALTFDDGPSSATTTDLLDILFKKDVPATFFVLGNMARNNPDIVRRAEKEGHIIGNHTMYHQNLIRLSSAAAKSDISESISIFNDILDHDPLYTRPPYGNYNNTVRSAAGTPLILWSVDSLDWQSKNVDSIVGTIMEQVHDGAIILMHDIYPTSVEAVPIIIDKLRASGYEFVTISELTEFRGISLTPGAAYYNFRP